MQTGFAIIMLAAASIHAFAGAQSSTIDWPGALASDTTGFSGVVLVGRDDAVEAELASGLADADAKRMNTPATRFNLGSINKTFTAIAIAQLIQQGRVSLDDTLAKHIVDYPNRAAAGRITVRDLLRHRSGVAQFMRADFGDISVAAMVTRVAGEPQAFEPGTSQQYSNGGYVVLGRIIEVASGKPYWAYIDEHIFQPAGMKASGVFRAGGNAAAFARGSAGTEPLRTGNPAGGSYSTAADLFRFARALRTGRLLDERMTRYVLEGTFAEQPRWGFALREQVAGDRAFVGNGGGAPGINAEFRFERAGPYTVVVLSNSSPPAATSLLTSVLNRIAGRGVSRPSRGGITAAVLTASSASRSPQSAPVPRFERGSCSFNAPTSADIRLECGSLVVARDRRQPNGRTFRLAVAVSRPIKPATSVPILYLAGGPSGVGGIRSGIFEGFARTGFNREVVVLDYRGQGLSEPSLDEICAGLTVEACIPRLKAQEIDHTTFNSAVNADDVRDLRRTLGYERWDVVGESYGARLAQEVMRRDAPAVGVVVLLAPVPVGPHLEAEMPRTFQRVIERVFSSCAAQAACAAAYPTLESDFYAVHEALDAKPIVISIPAGTVARSVVVDGRRFVRLLRQRFTEVVAEVPLIVHEIARGDRVGVVRRLVRDGGPAYPNNTLTNLVGCYDRFTPETRALGASVAAQVKAPFRQFQAQADECEYRRSLPPDAGYDDLIRSDIPTLIFANEFDDRTPVELGRRIASTLTHAHVIEIPGVHGEAPLNECGLAIAARFFAKPLEPPDTSCLSKMPPMRFTRPETGPVTLTFNIASDARSPFAGRWEAAFSAGGQYAFDLRIDGVALTGAIRSASASTPIQEGRATASEIRFSVRSPNGDRLITFTGMLEGDRILFTRHVRIRAGGSPGGAALFGAGSGSWFTAVRVLSRSR